MAKSPGLKTTGTDQEGSCVLQHNLFGCFIVIEQVALCCDSHNVFILITLVVTNQRGFSATIIKEDRWLLIKVVAIIKEDFLLLIKEDRWLNSSTRFGVSIY